MFKLVYANDNLQVSPCLDAGWDTDEVKTAILDAGNAGTFSESALRGKQYEYVVENTLKEIPSGLELYRVAGKYRIWKVPTAIGSVLGSSARIGGKPCRES